MADVEGVIRERLAEIDSEKRKLETALAELTSRQPRSRRRKATGTNPRKASGARRAKAGERPRQVLAHLENNPGARPSEIASAIKASPNQVYAVIAKLRTDRLVRKRGKGYGLARAAQPSTPATGPTNARRSKKSSSSKSSRQTPRT